MKHDMVCGFLFSPSGEKVVLIEKARPDWQKGKFNGVGGHIEAGETPLQAMRREFREEAGVDIQDWLNFVTLTGTGEDWRVNFFSAYDDRASQVHSETEEKIAFVFVEDLQINAYPTIANLCWLIPMALGIKHDKAERFDIVEHFPSMPND